MDHGFLAWITTLVRDHRVQLISLARAEGLLAQDALDAVQDAFESFLDLPHSRRLAFDADGSAKLLHVIVRNEARNRRRRHHLAKDHSDEPLAALPDDGESIEALIARAEEHAMAFGCVQRLGEMQRRVVTLRLLEDHSGQQVASLLGTSPGNVAVTLHRAKQALRSCMEE